MKQFFLILFGFFNLSSAIANGEEITTQQAIPSTAVHELSPVQQWLELQRSGKSASAQPQPAPGEVMEKVHQRYLKSFEKPIPEFYTHDPVTR